jgi:hypothetical protein
MGVNTQNISQQVFQKNNIIFDDDDDATVDGSAETVAVDTTAVESTVTVGDMVWIRQHRSTGKELTRKRQRNTASWKSNERKRLRQSESAYTDSNSKRQPAKHVKICKRNHSTCRFKCGLKFCDEDRENLHREHWMLNDTEKRYFYVSTTSVIDKVRCRKAANPNRKKSSVSYFFNKSVDEPVRVCKEFYLYTLDIDEKRVNVRTDSACKAA